LSGRDEPNRLRRLEVEDFGLIARASLEFAGGLTVCSGETGSGKTMLLGALGFVLGERSSPDVVRGGAARARVTLEVDAEPSLRERLAAVGFDLEEGEPAIFTREMQAGGKSSARINGRPATAAQLREAGEWFADFVGQHEQQRLLAHEYQLELLDRFAGPQAFALREAVAASYARAGVLDRDLEELRASEGRGLAEIEFARFALAEIEAASPEPGEDERLRERRDYLVNVERIAAVLERAHEALSGARGSAVEALGEAATALAGVTRYGGELAALADTLAALQSDATDAALAVTRAAEATEFDPVELESLGERLDMLERLKRKYGGTLEAVAESRARFAASTDRYATRDERRAELESAAAAARAELERVAAELSLRRTEAAAALERAVGAELRELAMPAARFEVQLQRTDSVGPQGFERVEFALAPNTGEPARSLVRAASGGELSRVLLALVVVLADRRERTALVFDEIDAGVAGATAIAVAQRLGALARDGQVICVTHLAQIASWADRHYTLAKRERGGATTIELLELRERDALLDELARMMSGKVAAVAVEHAETLLRDARKRKQTGKPPA
jgi:DNA repair protein RecN (Recombination protein N)